MSDESQTETDETSHKPPISITELPPEKTIQEDADITAWSEAHPITTTNEDSEVENPSRSNSDDMDS